MPIFSNSAWANQRWKPDQHEEASWLSEMEPAKRIDIRQIVADRLVELRTRRLPRALTPEHLRYVHKSLFSGLHWEAGNYRGTPIGDTSASVPAISGAKLVLEIADQMNWVFEGLRAQNYLHRLPKEEFVVQEANLMHGIINERPFYYGNYLVTKFIAGHVAENAGYKFDPLSVAEARFDEAIKKAVRNDLTPLRGIVRDLSRPEGAIIFKDAMKTGNWSAIYDRPRFQPAYEIVLEAIGGYNARGRIADGDLSPREQAVINKVQTELDAGRLNETPSGRYRAWFFDQARSPDR